MLADEQSLTAKQRLIFKRVWLVSFEIQMWDLKNIITECSMTTEIIIFTI